MNSLSVMMTWNGAWFSEGSMFLFSCIHTIDKRRLVHLNGNSLIIQLMSICNGYGAGK